jgi:hypothetical protein
MDLEGSQRLLARLCTDPELRGAWQGGDLDAAQRAYIVSLPRVQMQRFATSLIRKRLSTVRDLLPATARALGQDFGERFAAHAARPLAHTPDKHRRDALAFAAGLLRGRTLKGWQRDVLRLETAWLAAARPGPLLVVRLFRYPVARLARELMAEGSAEPGGPRPGLLVLWRPTRGARLRRLMLIG